MKHSIFPSMFKPRLIGEGGFSLRVAYQLNYVFRIQIRSLTYKPRGFLPGTYGIWFNFGLGFQKNSLCTSFVLQLRYLKQSAFFVHRLAFRALPLCMLALPKYSNISQQKHGPKQTLFKYLQIGILHMLNPVNND